jgi:hypothetical protein
MSRGTIVPKLVARSHGIGSKFAISPLIGVCQRGLDIARSYNVEVPLMLTTAMALSDAEIVDLLTAATTDLWWTSESDEPFTIVRWPDWIVNPLDGLALAKPIEADTATPITPVDLDEFFQRAITPQEWHEAVDRALIDRYEQLLCTLKQALTDLQVYRVGHCEVDVYIVGKTPAGHWLALKTMVVES